MPKKKPETAEPVTISTLKKWIVDAGTLEKKLKPEQVILSKKKKGIKDQMLRIASDMDENSEVVISRGSFVAKLTAPKRERKPIPDAMERLYKKLGKKRFLELASFNMAELEKEIGSESLGVLFPWHTGTNGRTFSISEISEKK